MTCLPEQLAQEVNRNGSVKEIVSIVQGLFLHCDTLALYNIEGKQQSRTTLPLRDRLKDLASFAPKEPEERMIVTCRDFALLTCALLREAGFESRVRCGFASYFIPGQYEDHWITEYKPEDNSDWIRLDSQLDDIQQKHYQFTSPFNLSFSDFMTAPEAILSLEGKSLPASLFGQADARGNWFLKVNLIRDFLSLQEIHTSSWDDWREAPKYINIEAEKLGKDWLSLARDVFNLSATDDIQTVTSKYEPLMTPFWTRAHDP